MAAIVILGLRAYFIQPFKIAVQAAIGGKIIARELERVVDEAPDLQPPRFGIDVRVDELLIDDVVALGRSDEWRETGDVVERRVPRCRRGQRRPP